MITKQDIEKQIKLLFNEWALLNQQEVDNRSKIRYAGPVLNNEDYNSMLDAIFSDWWSGGKYTNIAERKLAQISNRDYGLLTNAGSSANLLLMSAAKELYFKDGDKILTLSCSFPTTVNPIIQNNLIPVFVDIDLENLNLEPKLLEECLNQDKKIKGIFIAHTLGFKNKIKEIFDITKKYNIKVFFDNCDSYGSFYNGKPIQSYGEAATFSFYVAHHLTCGEGGGIVTDNEDLQLIMRGFRNWGKYCASPICCIRSEYPELFCPTGKLTKNCDLPKDQIVNYQYEWLGYNLKLLELQSAMLISQIDKLVEFNKIRKENYKLLYDYFKKIDKGFKIWKIDDDISPFSFPLLIPENLKFTRKEFMDYLKKNEIETRVLFGGNLMKHPAYINKKDKWESYGIHNNSDIILKRFVMLGVSPVNSKEHIERVIETIDDFLKTY